MDELVLGKYQLLSSTNFDEYSKACGVSFIYRKLAVTVESATMEFYKIDPETYVMKTTTAVKTWEQGPFKLGKEFTEVTMDGRRVQSVMEWTGNKLVHHQKDPKVNFESVIEREFTKEGMTTTCKCKGVVCVRKYKRLS
nr:FABP1 [Macrobiotus polonicus]